MPPSTVASYARWGWAPLAEGKQMCCDHFVAAHMRPRQPRGRSWGRWDGTIPWLKGTPKCSACADWIEVCVFLRACVPEESEGSAAERVRHPTRFRVVLSCGALLGVRTRSSTSARVPGASERLSFKNGLGKSRVARSVPMAVQDPCGNRQKSFRNT